MRKALWEEFIGFQCSHDGTFEPRFSGSKYNHANRNDYLHWSHKSTNNDNHSNLVEYMKNIPFKDSLLVEINKDVPIGKFYDDNKQKFDELIKQEIELNKL